MSSRRKQLFTELKVAEESIMCFLNLRGIIIKICLGSINRTGMYAHPFVFSHILVLYIITTSMLSNRGAPLFTA